MLPKSLNLMVEIVEKLSENGPKKHKKLETGSIKFVCTYIINFT